MSSALHIALARAYRTCRSARRTLAGGTREAQPATFTVLLYHGIPDRDRDGFRRQIDYLQEHTVLCDALDFPTSPDRRPHVAITFDDALASSFRNGIDELCRRNIPSLVFVATGSIGAPPAWVPAARGEADPVVSEAELRRYAASGVSFGSHTENHPRLSRIGPQQLDSELTRPRERLAGILGCSVDTLAFPFGDYSEAVLAASRRAGYAHVFSAIPDRPAYSADRFLISRVNVTADEPMDGFTLKAQGCFAWQGAAVRLKRMIRSSDRPRS